jgi:hypothetical protein
MQEYTLFDNDIVYVVGVVENLETILVVAIMLSLDLDTILLLGIDIM